MLRCRVALPFKMYSTLKSALLNVVSLSKLVTFFKGAILFCTGKSYMSETHFINIMGTRAAGESDTLTLTRPYTVVPNWDPDTKYQKQYMSKTASDTNLSKVLTCGLRLRLRLRRAGPKKRGRDLIGGARRGGAPSEGGGVRGWEKIPAYKCTFSSRHNGTPHDNAEKYISTL